MKRPASTIVAAAAVAGLAIIGVAGARFAKRQMSCGDGFSRRGNRCCPTPDGPRPDVCSLEPARACPPPLVVTPLGCDAPPRDTVLVPATSVLIGPADWEAEGRVKPRTVRAGPFAIDRFEITVGATRCPSCPADVAARFEGVDAARAASGITLDEARAICRVRGGRLPTEDEWIVAAAGDKPRRYPWGDTGAVCRRAAWGLVRGPCGQGATGPDTVGAHPDGATPLGVHDLAGNVAEWVEAGSGAGVARGGSFETELATEMRTWVRREVSPSTREPTLGFRCAYDAPGLPSGAP
ncbi:MAG: SUMF1/EgtB/PvdO family nonheme iron enzyme [Labilithrix sp.]|nr:SUMF1/EgtB/PvdO family nonheme iron enzyme [Labilithrix sp.]